MTTTSYEGRRAPTFPAPLAPGLGASVLLLLAWAAPPLEAQAPPKDDKKARLDAYGEPLPPGALARLGTNRLRNGGQVSDIAFAPDGKILATCGADGTASLWDVATGKVLRVLPAHPGNA